jgi:proteasome alpha subunit
MTAPFYVPPEQLVKDRAEFARKGVDRGRPIVVMALDCGILLVGENPSPSLRKIGEIYDRLAFAGVGRFNEFETLRVAGVRYADLKGYSYARADVTGKGIANAYSQTLGQIFTHEVKPYEVEILVAELGPEHAKDSLFRIRFDGTLQDTGPVAALGADEQAITEAIGPEYRTDLSLSEALVLATGAISDIMDREIAPTAWEAGFLDRQEHRRTFVRLSPTDVAEILGDKADDAP